MKSAVGFADLAQLFRALPVEDRLEAAALLGFRRVVAVPDIAGVEPAGRTLADPRVDAPPAADGGAAGRAGFFRLEAAAETAPAGPARPPPEQQQRLTQDELRSKPRAELPPSPPLAAWSTLWSRLHGALHAASPGRDPDVAALVRTWARGECLRRIPRRERRTWTASAAVWIDRSSRLTPFWDDQEMVVRHLVRLCGAAAIQLRVLDASRQAALAAWCGDLLGPEPPEPAMPVVVLGDLGFYGTASDRARWLRTARRLRREGVRVAALVPCPVRRWDRALARAWNAMPWERASTLDHRGTPEARAAALLRLVAPTALAQPGLLRALRRLLPAAEADAATEVDVWRHTDVQAADVHGLVLKTEASARWRAKFAAEVAAPPQAEVSRRIDRWHGNWRAELMHAETLAWIAHGVPRAPGRPAEAREFAEKVEATLCGKDGGGDDVAMVKHYGRHLLGAFPDQGYAEIPALKKVWSVAFADVADARLPSTIAPHELFVRTPHVPRPWAAYQRGEALVLVPAAAGAVPADRDLGSPVATITAAAPEIWVQRGEDARATRTRLSPGAEVPLYPGERVTLRSDCGEVTLDVWERAPWAIAAGRDRHGLWAAFEVSGVQQRVRWIPPGRFLMGSPPSEAGRWDDEGPQHEVTITKGYWLGETPVTQALWRAVMMNNPSRFVSDDRPVEQVSWDDCQKFIGRLNRLLDGLETRLPTEAEWERACRAGTTAATWVGDHTLRGENDVPELDAIAWYGGNSGVGFELDDGYDSSNWPQKQHPHTRAGTHPMGRKSPNPYGLHDMLGNVFEWCQDAGMREYTREPAEDPVSSSQGPRRVNRGGSWYSRARYVRAAYRFAGSRGDRDVPLGFRLAGGQVSALSRPAREPRSGDQGRGAGRDTSRASERDATTPRRNVQRPARPKRAKKKDA
jgi:formylglycine-generating enzyme required for sulfatase activity